jgi:hypothetical protein
MSTGSPVVTRAEFDALTQKVNDLDDAVSTLQQHVDDWKAALQTNDQNAIAAATALLDDANGWAQHFSTVRLGVTTFLLTIALGIMQFRWQDPTLFFVGTAAAIWGVAVVLFIFFTALEYSKIKHIQQDKQALLHLIGAGPPAKARTAWSDAPAYCLLAMTVFFGVGICLWRDNPRLPPAGLSTGGASPATPATAHAPAQPGAAAPPAGHGASPTAPKQP